MKRSSLILSLALVIVFVLAFAGSSAAKERATAEECVAKVKEAVKLIQEAGLEAALERLNDKDGPFRWKDSYVFVFDDEEAKFLAHPMRDAIGVSAKNWRDDTGRLVNQEILQVAKSKGEGWVTYAYNGTKKSYFLRIPGARVIVIAGFYPPVKTQVYGMEMTIEQEELWSHVQRSLELMTKKDFETLKTTMSDDFVYLGAGSLFTENRDRYVSGLDWQSIETYELRPIDVRISGNVGIVFFSWKFISPTGKVTLGRTTRTYTNQNGEWLYLAGVYDICRNTVPCVPF